MKLVLNFSHELHPDSVAYLKQELGEYTYLHKLFRIDFKKDLEEQIVQCVEEVDQTLFETYGRTLTSLGMVYMVAPGLTDPAILLFLELLGRTGDPPSIVMLRRDYNNGGFKVYKIVNGVFFRQAARGRRRL